MIKILNNMNLLFYIISLIFMETILKLSTSGELFSSNTVPLLIFSTSFAILFLALCSSFQSKINYILSVFLLGLFGLIFSSQLLYYKFFRTFYNVYSAGNGTQVFGFWKDIGTLVLEHSLWILLFFLPAILIAALGKRVFSYKKLTSLSIAFLIFATAAIHILGVAFVYASGKDQHSTYDLYFQNKNPLLSTERLGLLTTMRLDLQRTILGWSPISDVSAHSPVPNSGQTDIAIDENVAEEIKVKLEYNTMNIDFDYLIANEEDDEIRKIHQYFKSAQPSTKNDYTGKYLGYNLILITAESFAPYAVREDVTPTLYKMIHEGYNFTNFYTPLWDVSTTDGEYVALTGLLPKSSVWSFKESAKISLPFVMGNQLKALDYTTLAYHNHTYTYYRRDLSHPNMGYKYKGVGNGLKVKETWPASDLEMLEKTLSEYINQQPFHAYYMTVSGHMRYSFSGNVMARRNKEYVKDLPFPEQGQAYLATQIELNKALEYLLSQLDKAGIADKTLIAISADHYPYGLEDKTIDELAGYEIDKHFEVYKSPFVLYTKGMEPMKIDKLSSSLDIIPTLSNLLGLEYDSRLLMGRDIFSDSTPLIPFLNRSFLTDQGSYNSVTGEFIPNDGIEVEEDYVKWISAVINNKFYYSAKVLETDYYSRIFPQKSSR